MPDQPAAASPDLLPVPSLSVFGRRYDTLEAVRITTRGEVIEAVEPAWPDSSTGGWPLIAPGLFDLQINGHGGDWFSSRTLTPAQAARAIEAWLASGVTRLCPTLITASFESLSAGFSAIRQACESNPRIDRLVAGCHLEGPYLSAEDGPRGAHPREQIRTADWDEFSELQRLAGGRIRLMTIAPEVPHAIEFIRRAVESGVRVAIGHTAASGEQIRAAVDAGAVLSTHLGNGAHATLRRHPNYIWEQLGEPRLSASIIADGWHLPGSVVRSIVWAKSVRQTILTCDASGWAGCPPGRYENELGAVDVLPGGRIVVAGQDQILAGSGLGTSQCVARTVAFRAASLADSIDMACRNPARLLGFAEHSLKPGSRADLFLFRFDPDSVTITPLATIAAGVLRFGEIPSVQ